MISKRDELQANLFCSDCKLRKCNEQALGCVFRLLTRPNWQQKRKAANERKKARKRAKENGRKKPAGLNTGGNISRARRSSRLWEKYKNGKQ